MLSDVLIKPLIHEPGSWGSDTLRYAAPSPGAVLAYAPPTPEASVYMCIPLPLLVRVCSSETVQKMRLALLQLLRLVSQGKLPSPPCEFLE